jgi:BirA family biotin operon repressor/biotin-[acetyl-CoA-carboxylase] ligase
MKGRILNLLRHADGIVSGEMLRAVLGVSRVTVWKHVRALQACGYDIRASAKGYRLHASPDIPYSWEFPDREHRVHYFPEVDSTMRVARDMAQDGCVDLTVVTAGRQTAGRGRLARTWHSQTGGLYVTVVVRPVLPLLLSPRVNFAAGLALVDTLRSGFQVEASVKWPNDVLVKEHKIAGILSEMAAEADRIAYINVGLGLNVNNDPTPFESRAVSLKQLCRRPVSRKDILSQFLDRFEKEMRSPQLAGVVARWKEFTVTLQRRVRIVTVHESLEGRAVDVDAHGSLILELDSGELKTVLYGDCFHL